MDKVLRHYGPTIKELAKDCSVKGIPIIASEVFADRMTIERVAVFMAFAQNLVENHPDKKNDIYEKIFTSMYYHMKF